MRESYKYAILGTAVLVVFAALGLSQFSYPAILPAMQKGLGLTNTQAGALATANLAGYLSMAMLGGALASRIGPRAVITTGLVLASAGMLTTGLADGFGLAASGRALTGVGSAMASVPAHLLPTHWFSLRRRGVATGVLPLGASMGLVISGPLVPRLVGSYGESGWRITWFVLAALAACVALLAWAVIRRRQRPAPPVPDGAPAGPTSSWRNAYLARGIWHLSAIYFAFGFAYMTYMTFFTKRLISDFGYTGTQAGRLFMIMGLVSIVCGTMWGWISDNIGRRHALIIILGLQTVCYLLFALWTDTGGLTLSAVIFGLTAWATPAIMATACGDIVGPALASTAFGFLTAFQGLGQATGPYVGGRLADALPSFTTTYLIVAAVSLLGMVGAMFLPRRRRNS